MFRFGPVLGHVPFLSIITNLRWGNALSHKLEVGERRSLASHCTLTTGNRKTPVVHSSDRLGTVRKIQKQLHPNKSYPLHDTQLKNLYVTAKKYKMQKCKKCKNDNALH